MEKLNELLNNQKKFFDTSQTKNIKYRREQLIKLGLQLKKMKTKYLKL